jgi:hypothetical protein
MPKILDDTVKNVVARVSRSPGFVQSTDQEKTPLYEFDSQNAHAQYFAVSDELLLRILKASVPQPLSNNNNNPWRYSSDEPWPAEQPPLAVFPDCTRRYWFRTLKMQLWDSMC